MGTREREKGTFYFSDNLKPFLLTNKIGELVGQYDTREARPRRRASRPSAKAAARLRIGASNSPKPQTRLLEWQDERALASRASVPARHPRLDPVAEPVQARSRSASAAISALAFLLRSRMNKPRVSRAREKRIMNEIVVDAYTAEVRSMELPVLRFQRNA